MTPGCGFQLNYASLLDAKPAPRQEMNDYAQSGEDGEVINGGGATGTWREVYDDEDLISGAEGDEEEHAFAEHCPQSETGSEEDDALGFAEGERGLAAVEDPDRNEIEKVHDCANARQGCPEWIAGLPP